MLAVDEDLLLLYDAELGEPVTCESRYHTSRDDVHQDGSVYWYCRMHGCLGRPAGTVESRCDMWVTYFRAKAAFVDTLMCQDCRKWMPVDVFAKVLSIVE